MVICVYLLWGSSLVFTHSPIVIFEAKLVMKKNELCLILGILLGGYLFAQTPAKTIPEEGEWLEIGGISVQGVAAASTKAMITVSGLKVGDRIQVPGHSFQKAIRALWSLQLFRDIQIVEEKRTGDVIFLKILLEEMPRLTAFHISGIKRSWQEPLRKLAAKDLIVSAQLSKDTKARIKRNLQNWLAQKGYYFAKIELIETYEKTRTHLVLDIRISVGNKAKVQQLRFAGNKAITDRELRRQIQTKDRHPLFGKRNFVPETLEQDQKTIIQYYHTKGYLDATIVHTRIDTLDSDLTIKVQVEEGLPYRFRKISWKGNVVYTDKTLNKILGIRTGDIYNPIRLEQRLRFDPKGRDINALYLDHGYLFFEVNPVITYMKNQEIDVEIQIKEGPLAKIGTVAITGNDQTHENVIRRELHTQPGQVFSRAAILKSQQALINLGYFNPASLDLSTKVNPEEGTVDLTYQLEEKPSSKYELSASWNPAASDQGGGLVGTIGVTLNNFSLRKLFQKEKGSFMPMGDGQTLSLRAQSTGRDFQGLNFSFTEPWLGGKKPNSLTLATFYQRFTNHSSVTDDNPFASMSTIGGSLQLGTRLNGWGGNFVTTSELSYQHIALNGLDDILLEDGNTISTGHFNNLYFKQSLTYYTLSDPFFPTKGIKFQLSGQITPPYSLFSKSSSSSFKWMEYHKWRVNAEWFQPISRKLIVKLSGKTGWLNAYDSAIGIPPFERFEVGGNGTNTQQLAFAGNDLISLRGYPADYLEGTLNGGGASFAKFAAELRYPVLEAGSSRAFILAFGEAGNVWKNSRQFNLGDLRPAVGLGIRLQLPFLGMIGFDYGFGLNRPELSGQAWDTYGTLNLILGIEPE